MRFILTIITLVLFTTPSWSADFYKGLLAYNNGDYATAFEEWTPLAEQGDADAQYNLAIMYDNGQGVLQDYQTAVKWYTLAAEQGLAKSQYNLGISYAKGEGVIQDFLYTHMWLNISASIGNDDAPNARKIVEVSMTPAQIEQAQALARECVKKEYKDC